MKTNKILSVISSLVIVAIIFTGCSVSGNKNVELVREGTMEMAPNVPIGKAFSQFFDNGTWKSFKSKKGNTIVEFKGNCYYLDENVSMTIQFKILNDEQFNLQYIEINGVNIPEEMQPAVLQGILENYQP